MIKDRDWFYNSKTIVQRTIEVNKRRTENMYACVYACVCKNATFDVFCALCNINDAWIATDVTADTLVYILFLL